MMRRRLFCALSLTLALPVRAQTPPMLPRVGYMALPTSSPNVRLATFTETLQRLGYLEGQNIAIEYRHAEGKYDRFPAIAKELVALNVNVIVADDGTPSAIAARNATQSIPIVFTVVNDPVSSGLVKTLARPGGNVTGLSLQSPETTAKRLQTLKEILPLLRRVVVLVNPMNESMNVWRHELPAAANKLGIELIVKEARNSADIEAAFDGAAREGANAMIISDDALFYAESKRIGALATWKRLPVIGGNIVIAEDGGLASYGADRLDLVRRSAALVDKILKGAKAADLPIEQPSKFDLVVNLKAAKALKIDVPKTILLRADKLIE